MLTACLLPPLLSLRVCDSVYVILHSIPLRPPLPLLPPLNTVPPPPGVKRTFPHIPICGTEFPGVEQEAGAVLLVAFPCGTSPDGAPLIRAQHLVDGGTVLVR